jgi:hypothetical protein
MSYDLDISQYSFTELLGLFDLESEQVTMDDLQRAKRKVFLMHPDKSRLPAEYFLFYKKAYDIVLNMFENIQKVAKSVPHNEDIVYKQDQTNKHFQKNLQQLSPETFQQTFHSLYEKHMSQAPSKKNDWFREEAAYEDPGRIHSADQIGEAMERMKQNETQRNMVVHKDVALLTSSRGANVYDEDEDDYVVCDPFSKLKYDDLRKVHKDQTIFHAIRENDIQNIPVYASVDHYKRVRAENEHVIRKTPSGSISEEEWVQFHRTQNKREEEILRQKQYQSQLKQIQMKAKNDEVMASFLKLH